MTIDVAKDVLKMNAICSPRETQLKEAVEVVTDEINRQKTEIERYKGVIKRLEDDVRLAKIEAIKDFDKLIIDKIDSGVVTHSLDIVDLVADEVERIEKGR